MNEIEILKKQAIKWLEEDDDPVTANELKTILSQGDHALLADLFGRRLHFGTAGLRGILGPGTNRMNRIMVRKTTAGLADYILQSIPEAKKRGVVIGYDARQNSRIFAEESARILLGKGMKVYGFEEMIPTPLVSYATYKLRAAGGIMITASHNPPEYNGYKVYWETGGQIVPPHDSGILNAIDKIEDTRTLAKISIDDAKAGGLYIELGDSLTSLYLDDLSSLCVHKEASQSSLFRIAYTPLHGVGAKLTKSALLNAGFNDVHIVPEQMKPDGLFPTVNFPNPEEEGAMDAVIQLGRKINADIAIAADPDADRFAAALPVEKNGNWRMMDGDEVGIALAYYLLTEKKGGSERALATTIVSSRMLSAMAKDHGVHYIETLTGLKWIIDAVLRHQSRYQSTLLMGYENALGYTIGNLVRDKDGISAALIFAEMAAWLKSRGKTVWDLLEEAYRAHGFFLNRTKSIVFSANQMDRIEEIMSSARNSPPNILGKRKILSTTDLEKDETGLPKTNLLVFELENEARVLMRPSGTEPKLKSYYEVKELIGAHESMIDARTRAVRVLEEIEKDHQGFIKKAF